MNDLLRLKTELERQDRALAVCFEQMQALDPELEIVVSPEWMGELALAPEPSPRPLVGALRA